MVHIYINVYLLFSNYLVVGQAAQYTHGLGHGYCAAYLLGCLSFTSSITFNYTYIYIFLVCDLFCTSVARRPGLSPHPFSRFFFVSRNERSRFAHLQLTHAVDCLFIILNQSILLPETKRQEKYTTFNKIMDAAWKMRKKKKTAVVIHRFAF